MEKFLDINFENDDYQSIIPTTTITDWINDVLTEVKYPNASVTIIFTDEKQIHELNKQFLGRDYPTDVLSFSQFEGEQCDFIDSQFLGDILICMPYAQKQAAEKAHSIELEIKFLLLHGILHLIGHDHDDEYRCEMNDLENSIFHKLTGETID